MAALPQGGLNGPGEVREHLPLLELLRILASVAVVHYHMRTGFLLGVGFGLPLFLLILFGLSCSGSTREPLARFARRKARFLLVPWLRWSLIYLGVLIQGNLAGGRATFDRLEGDMLFYGGHLSLWFLPFATLAVIAAKGLQRWAVRFPIPTAMLAAALLAALWTAGVACAMRFDLPRLPTRFWLLSSPAILWGLALGQSLRLPTMRSRRVWLAAVALVSTLAFVLSPSAGDFDSISHRYALAVPLVCLGFAWKPRIPSFVPALSSLCFGVYLVHSLVGNGLLHVFEMSTWPAFLHTGAAWALSALLVAGLRRAGVPWHELASRERPTRSTRIGRPHRLHELSQKGRKAA